MTNCPLCQGNLRQIHNNFTGYIEGQYFPIFQCQQCQSQSIQSQEVDYNTIYESEQYPWYNKFIEIAKHHPKPLKELARLSAIYKPVYDFINTQTKPLRILDVGCGYGYLVHSLRRESHRALGIDISSKAIETANKNFGNYFSISSTPAGKYDLIIATEIIEHVQDPRGFIQQLMESLNPNGALLITTPNKNFYDSINLQAIWKTDLPPVHQTWITREGLELAAKPFAVAFYNYPLLYADNYFNLLLEARAARNNYTPLPKINKDKTHTQPDINLPKKILKSKTGNRMSTVLARIITQDHPTLSACVYK